MISADKVIQETLAREKAELTAQVCGHISATLARFDDHATYKRLSHHELFALTRDWTDATDVDKMRLVLDELARLSKVEARAKELLQAEAQGDGLAAADVSAAGQYVLTGVWP